MFYPSKIEEQTTLRIEVKNFPATVRPLNLTLESQNDKIELNCTVDYTVCVNAPNALFSNSLNVGTYFLKASNYENNVSSKLFINSEPLIIYSKF
jgi:hypothetical protein